MKIAILDADSVELNNDIDWSAIETHGSVRRFASTRSEQVIKRCTGCDCIVTNKVEFNQRHFTELPQLRLIVLLATGYNNIDIDAAQRHNIVVSNVPGYAKDSVPQHVFALLLNLATSAHRYHRDVLNGEWAKSTTFTLLKYSTFELAGKTMGVVGFGSIGSKVAEIARSFGMHVLMHRRSGQPKNGFMHTSIEQLLVESDVVSLNCPLTDENRYMINRRTLQIMPPHAILINTARGPLVNQRDLADALRAGIIGGAAIDVLDEEPPKDNPLFHDVPNLILSPHSAWSTCEARQRLVDQVGATIAAFLSGAPMNNVV